MKLGANFIDNRLAPLILNSTVALIVGGYMSYVFFSNDKISITSKGIVIVALAGLCAAIGNLSNFKAFQLGGNASVVIPFVAIGSALIPALLGVLILKEQVSGAKVLGVVLGLVSIYLMVK